MSLRRRLQTSASFRRAATKVRDVLPFGVRRLLQTAWNTDVFAKPRFAGLYQSFEAVPNSANPPIDSETIRLSLGSMQHDGGNGFVIFRHGHDLLSVVAAMLGGGELSILDFGGAAGLDYKGLKAATESVGHYCVVELPEICRLASKAWPGGDEGRLTFSHDLPPSTEHFDIVYAYSAIHYAPNPFDLLARFIEYKPRAILLVHHPVTTLTPSFVRSQRGEGGIRPAHVLSLREIEAALPGYRLAFHASDDLEMNVENFEPMYRVGRYSNLLFLGTAH